MLQAFLYVLKVVAAVFVAVPLLFVTTCAYTSFSPHLRSDPFLLALMDAQQDVERRWRTVDVVLIPQIWPVGSAQSQVLKRLERSGFKLVGDYSVDQPPIDPNPDDTVTQASLDKLFAQSKSQYDELGITHVFERGGRTRPACGESLLVQIGIVQGQLTQASGYSRWTCL